MKRKCLYCEKTFDDQNGLVCPNCQNDNDIANPDQDKVHKLHQECHRKINRNSEIFDSSMTFVVIGTLLLIVGSVFLFLSFRKNNIGIRNFTPGSTEFVISVLSLATGVSFLAYGITRVIIALRKLKKYRKIIQDTNF